MSESNNSDNQEKVLVTFKGKEIETTESAIEKYSSDENGDGNGGIEVYVENILENAIGIDPEGLFACFYLDRFFDKNYNVIGYKVLIHSSNIKLKSDDQKKFLTTKILEQRKKL